MTDTIFNKNMYSEIKEANQFVNVTLSLPVKTYERIEQVALSSKKRPEDLLISLVTTGLDINASIGEILESVSLEYRHRLSQEGRLDQPPDLVMQELGNIREQIAYELYS
ncbi:MAG TPA: hypothetical protein V6C58_02170 [Allocoleopsis sp.]